MYRKSVDWVIVSMLPSEVNVTFFSLTPAAVINLTLPTCFKMHQCFPTARLFLTSKVLNPHLYLGLKSFFKDRKRSVRFQWSTAAGTACLNNALTISVILSCGGSSAENCSYIVQAATTTISPSCAYTICPKSNNICRIRYDFTVSARFLLQFVEVHHSTCSVRVLDKLSKPPDISLHLNWCCYSYFCF